VASHSLSQLVSLAVLIAAVAPVSCSKRGDVEPIATLEQIMETTVEPVSDRVFDAAVWENGVQVGGPRTEEDWKLVHANAMMLAETCNLLLMPGRAKDEGSWVVRTQAMKDAALEAAKAAEAKDTDAIFVAGGHIFQACTACHLQYIPQMVAPPARP
jgi:putative intracellular protease/amidase